MTGEHINAAAARLADPYVRQRIRDVCSLKAGWFDQGSGEAVDVDPQFVERVVRALEFAGHGTPGIYATLDGEVQLEWPDGREIVVR